MEMLLRKNRLLLGIFLLVLLCFSMVFTVEAEVAIWIQAYGGTDKDYPQSVVETSDGGYAITGYTASYGVGGDFWLVKTDSSGTALWNQTYGGIGSEVGHSVVQTTDGGYAIAGETRYSYSDSVDFWLVKTDSAGMVQWNQTYGGPNDDYGWSVVQTTDGGYAIAGFTQSYGVGTDFWLVKTDSAGIAQWNRTYGGPTGDFGASLVQTSDGGYAIAGRTNSYGVGNDFWLVKTDQSGAAEWNQTYGGPNYEEGHSVVQTSDGGYAIAGHTNSYGTGDYDIWLVKTDDSGTVEWTQAYGGTGTDYWGIAVETSDGGFAIVGTTWSFGAGSEDILLIKTDEHGVVPEAEWVILPLLLLATLVIFIGRKKLLHPRS